LRLRIAEYIRTSSSCSSISWSCWVGAGAQARAGSERTPERGRRPATSTKRRVLEVETTEERTLSVGVFKEEVPGSHAVLVENAIR